MSAFMVSDKHINTLLTWLNRNGQYGDHSVYTKVKKFDGSQIDDLQEMAEILVNENKRSLNERYEDAEDLFELSNYGEICFEFTNGTPKKPVEIIKACDCYDYQACETDDYNETQAHEIIEAIRNLAIDKLEGYEEAAWEIV